jgi:hypothetical protein
MQVPGAEFAMRVRLIAAVMPMLALAACGGGTDVRDQQLDELLVRAEAAAVRAEKAQKSAEMSAATASRRAETIASGVEVPDPEVDGVAEQEAAERDADNAVADNSDGDEGRGG